MATVTLVSSKNVRVLNVSGRLLSWTRKNQGLETLAAEVGLEGAADLEIGGVVPVTAAAVALVVAGADQSSAGVATEATLERRRHLRPRSLRPRSFPQGLLHWEPSQE